MLYDLVAHEILQGIQDFPRISTRQILLLSHAPDHAGSPKVDKAAAMQLGPLPNNRDRLILFSTFQVMHCIYCHSP